MLNRAQVRAEVESDHEESLGNHGTLKHTPLGDPSSMPYSEKLNLFEKNKCSVRRGSVGAAVAAGRQK